MLMKLELLNPLDSDWDNLQIRTKQIYVVPKLQDGKTEQTPY
jgi:hypothetical protein